MTSRVTIDDVAALARVSTKTVSRVLNEEPNVRPATRKLVLEAIGRLGFRPSRVARSLAAQRAFILGLFYDNPCANYVSSVQAGALAACGRLGYDLSIHPKKYEGTHSADAMVEMYRQSRYDGIILTPPLSDITPLVAILRAERVPCVLVSPADSAMLEFPSVVTNDRAISEEMTRRLIALGHKRIAFVAGHPDHKAVALRLEGYRAAMRAAALPVPAAYVVQGFNTFDSGEQAGRALLAQEPPPSAVYCANDEMAAGVLKAAHTLGVEVPRALSIAGFDNIPIAVQVWPQLSTVVQPVHEMAERAAEILVRKINDPEIRSDEEHVVIESSLMFRGSTAAYAA